MAELIAQGSASHERWRRKLPDGQWFILGREAGGWSVPWDHRVSRQHAELRWQDGKLDVCQLAQASNPVFKAGAEAARFSLAPGECFVIGETVFTLSNDRVAFSLNVPRPVEEQTYSSQYLQRVNFRNADQRIEVLTRLPDVISGAVDDSELFVGLVNMLLAGIPRASAVALVVVDTGSTEGSVKLLHWDRRLAARGAFEPSQRLIVEAIRRGQSVLHVWGPGHDSSVNGPKFTVSENVDWAFCTPVPGKACPGWGVYVAGRYVDNPESPAPSDPTDLREDLKFTELVAATLNSLRHVQSLERTQSNLTQFFAPPVLQALATKDPNEVLQPRETEVSVLFCDLRGFSKEAEKNAADLLGLLHRVSKALGVMTRQILDHGGVFGDFQGDAAMGFWGWPLPQPNTIEEACQAALGIRMEFEAAAGQVGHPLADFRMGVGLATGRAVAGRIGTVDQAKVSVFGPVVNLASRLEGMTKLLRAPILLDEPTAAVVREKVPRHVARCRRVAKVQPYGLKSSLVVSELLPPESSSSVVSDQHIASYEQALDAFLTGDWSEAMDLLHEVPAKDRVKDFLTLYIVEHNRVPPTNWNGVIPLTSKG